MLYFKGYVVQGYELNSVLFCCIVLFAYTARYETLLNFEASDR